MEGLQKLQTRYAALEVEKKSLERENLRLREVTGSLELDKERLQEKLDYYVKKLYGRKSERFENPAQLDFFRDGGLELTEPSAASSEDEPAGDVKGHKRRKKKGPAPLPDHLPRERVECDPNPAACVCGCCGKNMDRVGETITEELVVEPPKFKVRQNVQGEFRCQDCMSCSVQKPLPPRPIEKGRPSPSLLAYIVVLKYVDHMPLYRQEQSFKRIGYELSRKTMDGWLGALAGLLMPIVRAVERQLLETDYLQVDETVMRYLAEEKKGKSQQGYLWAVTRPLEEIVYHFTTSRGAKHPRAFLAGFRGKLQTDGYAAYDCLTEQGVIQLACLAHIRRGFYDSRKALPQEVDEILELIRKLYEIERRRETESLSEETFRELRETESMPIARELRSKVEVLAEALLPKSKLGKAAQYALNMWSRFEATLATPQARLDNNWVENAMRPAALGRKNWLFLGSPTGGGQRLEAFLSLAQSCRRLGANPFDYFVDVIDRISTHPQSRIDELTPRGWMAERGIPIGPERRD